MFGSQPLSYLNDASVLKLCLLDDFRILIGLKYADSKKISLVSLFTLDSTPPITPAIHIGFFASFIIKSSDDNLISLLSSVINLVSFFVLDTTTFFP